MNADISSDPGRLRIEEIRTMLSGTYWCPDITTKEIRQGIEHSALLVGAYDTSGRQLGFCRVISDKTRFAYLLDVVVAEECRHQGIGQAMVRFAVTHPALKDVYQWLLKTSDAHGMYGKCGFEALDAPEQWMGRMQQRPDRSRFSR